jgi:8-hydroxy-5-deazaflavin:NADPH oxidoreductase
VAASAMGFLRERLPGARLVKAFNTIGAEHMLDPDFGGVAADLLVCADDAGAKAVVQGLAAELGFAPVDAGPLANATLTEHLAALWIWLALRGGQGRDIAITLRRKAPAG